MSDAATSGLAGERASLAAYLADFTAENTQQARFVSASDVRGGGGFGSKHSIRGIVIEGGNALNVTLTREQDGWRGRCTCAVGVRCRHLYALGAAWLAGARASDGGKNAASCSVSLSTGRKTFRDTWAPQLATEIGRPLTDEETRLLGRLSALFAEMRQHGGRVSKGLWWQNGFAAPGEPDPLYGRFEDVMPDWWPREKPPADPWALWQYVAHRWQLDGRALPEAFLPMTDTAPVRAYLDQRQLREELSLWKRSAWAGGASSGGAVSSGSPIRDELRKVGDFRLRIHPDGVVRLEALAAKPKLGREWIEPTQKWLKALAAALPSDTEDFPPAARRIALLLRLQATPSLPLFDQNLALPSHYAAPICRDPECHPAVHLPDGEPFRIEPEPLVLTARSNPEDRDRLDLEFSTPDGRLLPVWPSRFLPLAADNIYLVGGRLFRGPPPPPHARLPVAALADPALGPRLREFGLRLPDSLGARFREARLRPRLRVGLRQGTFDPAPILLVRLEAVCDSPPCAQEWRGRDGWRWLRDQTPPAAGPDDPHLRFDLAAADAVGARFADLRLTWWAGEDAWTRPAGRDFPDNFLAWRDSLPPGVEVLLSPELRSLADEPYRARLEIIATSAEEGGRDWFDVHVELKPEDLSLTAEEIRLLLAARGGWARLPDRGWRRLQVEREAGAAEALEKLGLPADLGADGEKSPRERLRYHALQLAQAPLTEAGLAASLRERVDALRAELPAPLPAGLRAELRPYQIDGYNFLVHLSRLGLGGVLADDMGLGKTLQTLAWLLRLSAEISNFRSEISNRGGEVAAFRALIVCPKSVVPNWVQETARFAPALSAVALPRSEREAPALPVANLLVVNYAQLRLRADALRAESWDAVVLDEGQNIKTPASATARVACELRAAHRLVLSGTPVENRLLDLWSLMHFAQPGLLGDQASFQRLYSERTDPADARARLAARVRPFLLRRTKSQVAKDLPPRIEEEIVCELEGPQRTLYEAELKRARRMLLDVKTERQFDARRFNILQSLLRLRQICCDARLLGFGAEGAASGKSDAAPSAPGAKIEALFDALEPLVAEGHRVLVFSQFTRMLEFIRVELERRGIGHLLLTGQTENRRELVERFQAAEGPPVFLLSLKAAGAGLNLTVASYVVLFDPWWNPAVEAQAIDRTHRIGQSNTVIAYRLLAKGTVEEKIRALQKEKAALAAAVVQEESLASVMDLESLRRILG